MLFRKLSTLSLKSAHIKFLKTFFKPDPEGNFFRLLIKRNTITFFFDNVNNYFSHFGGLNKKKLSVSCD